jgi:hypothetical protein
MYIQSIYLVYTHTNPSRLHWINCHTPQVLLFLTKYIIQSQPKTINYTKAETICQAQSTAILCI